MSLLVISTHPIQYNAPVYQVLNRDLNVPTIVIYGSDFSVVGYKDKEFGTEYAWDIDLLKDYKSMFLSRTRPGSYSSESVTAGGVAKAIQAYPDVQAILLLGYRIRFDLRAFWAARRTGLPMFFRSETTDHARQRSGIKSQIRDCFLRWFYQQFDYLLYIGHHSRLHYERLGVPSNRLIFSPYCVSDAQFQLDEVSHIQLRQKLRKELAITKDQIVLLFSGKLVHRKGPDLLIEAVRELPESLRLRIVVVFLGDGEMRAKLEGLCNAPGPYISSRFVGFQNQSHLSPYYHAADMLIVPSRNNETWGLVVNEALMHGLPCVASDRVGCAPDLVKSKVTGELFESESIRSLADAIVRTMNLASTADTYSRCRELVGGFSVHEAAQGIARAYSALHMT